MINLEIPEKYYKLYEDITNPERMVHMKWYKYPTDPFKAEFMEWYAWRTMNIEFSDNKTHLRIVDFQAMPIPKWSNVARLNNNHYLTKARSPERLQAQKEYWENFWNNRHVAIEHAYEEDEIDELSIF